jgi:(1->4)-alpha-D-glucan 1-alpha-D-glucosylmutase
MMAKSLEDTAFYRHHRLIALNEVGGHPAASGLSAENFHARMLRRAQDFRHGLTATATHDTKRGEDARMRILALSEIAGDWAQAVAQWQEMNASLLGSGESHPSPAHQYLLYQALLGAWPDQIDADFVKRMQGYAVKAAREGKLETSWVNPSEDYEAGLQRYVQDLLDRDKSAEFLASFDAFAKRTALLGALNSLSQLVLKATMPGVPDFYQGTEFWDLSLVDPDNRRPVDFTARSAALANLPGLSELIPQWGDGRIKLALTRRLLALRNELPALFLDGGYEPIEVTGRDAGHIVAFSRTHGRQRVVVAVGRHFASVTDGGRRWPVVKWDANLALGSGKRPPLRDALGTLSQTSPETLAASELLQLLPVVVLRTT